VICCIDINRLGNRKIYLVPFFNSYQQDFSLVMSILKTLSAGKQAYFRRSYATASKLIEITRDNDTGKKTIALLIP